MAYTYVNGIYEVTTPIHDGYKRFHSMNAQYAYNYDEESNSDNWDFVSYAMPICTVEHDRVSDYWFITITCDAFDQSRSTNRQITRFLREIGSPFTVRELRDLVSSGFANKYDYINGKIMHVRGEVNRLFYTMFYA